MAKKVVQAAKAKKNAKALKLKEVAEKINAGLQDYIKSGRYAELLMCMSNLGKYSLNNQLWLMLQMPSVSKVGTFKQWQAQGRTIKAGEKAIHLLAPITIVDKDDKKNSDDKTPTVANAVSAKPKKERVIVVGFRSIPVFDISQTDGPELPKPIEVPEKTVPDYDKKVAGLMALAQKNGYKVSFDDQDMEDGCDGWCNHRTHEIHVRPYDNQYKMFSTLCHECGHMLAHSKERSDFKGIKVTDVRGIKELEAQSIAAVVCNSVGLPISDWDFGYIAGWAGELAPERFRKNLEVILKCSKEELEAIGA